MQSWIRRALFVLALGLLFEGTGHAQSQPTSFSFQPEVVYQGGCYDIVVGGGANMTLDAQITYPGGSVTAAPWFTLDGDGRISTCVPIDFGVGTYTVTVMRNTLLTGWVNAYASVTVLPVNPTSLSIDHSSGYAGTSSACKTLTFGDGADMYAQILYRSSLDGYSTERVGGPYLLDGNGRWSSCDTHNDIPQVFLIGGVRNYYGGAGWTYVDDVYWTLYPPQPTSLSFTPTVMNQGGGNYTWNVGNGGGETLDIQLTTTLGGAWTGYNVVTLDTNSTAHATSSVSADQPLGLIHVTGLKNSANTAWASVDATLQICPSAPTVTGTSVSSGVAGTTISVTITGTKFYCVSGLAQQSGSGSAITTSGWTTPSNPATSLTATFTIPSDAGYGTHTMQLSAGGGSANFNFEVVEPTTITDINPTNATRGTSGSITITGTNLSGATLSGPNGVTFSSVSTSATSITAAYTVACNATVATGTLTVFGSSGDPTTTFTVNDVLTPTITGITPLSSRKGTSPSVTISGTNLCGATLSPTGWTGLSIGTASSTFTSATATFTIASTADAGSPPITVTNNAGQSQSTTLFTITTPPVSPTTLSISPGSGYAGNSSGCKTLTFGNAANMTVDMKFQYSGDSTVYPWGPQTLDANGQYSNCDPHNAVTGTMNVFAIRNHNGGDLGDWVTVSASWTLYPPQPTSLSYSPTVVNQGTSYVWNVGNGGGQALDVQLTTTLGGAWTGYNVVSLDNNEPAHATSGDNANQPLGVIHATAIKNTLNTDWVSVDATLQICPSAPTVTGTSVSSGTAATTVSVTITGTKIYCVSSLSQVSGSGSAITASGWTTPSTPDTSLTATFTIPAGAGAGVHTMRLAAGGGYSDFNFTVVPSITSINPTNATRGTSGSITITGTSLTGGVPSGPSGVTYTNVSSSATSVEATYTVACNATVGAGTLTVTPSYGSATATFTVNNPSTPTISSVSPSSSSKGTSPSVTLTGTNLNCAGLSPNSWNGLTITGVSSTSTSATATFNVSSSATTGTPTITVTNAAGLTQNTNGFTITAPAAPSVTGINLSSSGLGSQVSVTLTGADLSGASLSTSTSGLTFSGTSSTSTSVTALYAIAANATTGASSITVTTGNGSTSTGAFSIVDGLFWKQDYIRDGSGIIIATARPAPFDTTAPTAPSGLTVTSFTSTSVTLSWTASTDSGGSGLAGYKIYRQTGSGPSLPIGAEGDSTVTFTDVTLQSGHTYNYTVVAVDKAENYSSASGSVGQATP